MRVSQDLWSTESLAALFEQICVNRGLVEFVERFMITVCKRVQSDSSKGKFKGSATKMKD